MSAAQAQPLNEPTGATSPAIAPGLAATNGAGALTGTPTGAPPVPKPVAPRTRRQPKWIAAGLLAICLGALGAVLLYTEAVTSRSVVMVANDVSRGELIQTGDLVAVTIGSVPGVRTVPADRLAELIGQHATVDLVAGSLLPDGAVGRVALPAGQAQLGLQLAPGRLPLEPLPTGTPVQLVAVASATSGAETDDDLTGRTFDASILQEPRLSADGQAYLLDVRLAEASAVTVAQLAAADRLVLVRKPER